MRVWRRYEAKYGSSQYGTALFGATTAVRWCKKKAVIAEKAAKEEATEEIFKERETEKPAFKEK